MTVTRILAIDPGNEFSAWLLYDKATGRPTTWAKEPNADVLRRVAEEARAGTELVVEMIASYGMPVGAEVFETCVWIGRFIEQWVERCGRDARLLYRRAVKLHLCNSSRAKDAHVRQSIIDRFGPGKHIAIGLKATPGPLYGLSGDGWAALGVAITAAEVAA